MYLIVIRVGISSVPIVRIGARIRRIRVILKSMRRIDLHAMSLSKSIQNFPQYTLPSLSIPPLWSTYYNIIYNSGPTTSPLTETSHPLETPFPSVDCPCLSSSPPVPLYLVIFDSGGLSQALWQINFNLICLRGIKHKVSTV